MAISRIETGKRVVTDFELKLFSSVLGLSMDDLTGRRSLARFLRSAPPLISARSPFGCFPSPASGSRLSIFHILLHRV